MRDIVVYIGSIFLPDKSAGAQRSLSLGKSLRDAGMQVVIVGMDADLPAVTPILDTKGTCAGFDTFAVPQPKSLKQWVHHTVSIAEFKKVVDYFGTARIHSIITMEYEAVALWKLSRYCRKNGIHLIADAEEWYEHSRLRFPMNVAKNLDTALRMYWVYPREIHNMICISRFFESYYSNKVKNRVYIPGTIDKSDEKWQNLPEYTPNKVFTIGYAGYPGLEFEKERLDLLIRAVQELYLNGLSLQLVIAGVDKAFIKKRMPNFEIITECVRFEGQLKHQECLWFLARCDYSAIIREDKRVTLAGFPTKLSESFGCGTPVIATRSSNISDYIDDKTGFLCDKCDVKDIKTVIVKAYKVDKATLICIHKELRANPILLYRNFTDDLKKFIERI